VKEQETSSAWRAAWRARSTRALRRRGEVRGGEGREPRRAANTAWGMRRSPAMNSTTRKASAAVSGGIPGVAEPRLGPRREEEVQAGGLLGQSS
jgi:hypothetical protein